MGSEKNKEPNKAGVSVDLNQYPDGLYMTKIIHSSETEVCIPFEGESLAPGEMIIVKTRYGNDMVKVLGSVTDLKHVRKGDLREVVRRASEEDLKKAESFKVKETDTFKICRDKIDMHKLDMSLVSAHYLLDEPKVMFFFTGRIGGLRSGVLLSQSY
jgi:cell fate regulator YaaT (PSP1 superfamily)